MNNYIPKKDYNLIKFSKEEKKIVKRIKEYAFRNCRKEIEQSYITKTLNIFDYGFAFFRTKILTINKLTKTRPCAFACIQNLGNNTLYLLLICSVRNIDDLGTKIMNEVIKYARENKYIKITLECNEKNMNFYEKFEFINEKITNNEIHYMIKTING